MNDMLKTILSAAEYFYFYFSQSFYFSFGYFCCGKLKRVLEPAYVCM